MANAPTSPIVRYVRNFTAAQLAATLPDAHLLQRFVAHCDEAAFAALVRRHGPLVLGACRRVLNDRHAAEDVFQATFLVLARKAGSLKQPEALGPWLYGVATRTALKAKTAAVRRRQVERQAALDPAVARPDNLDFCDLRPVLDEAVAGLADSYRVPFVLHHLEGATVAEVARRLGCPPGTIAARLARAKARLRTRLARRGVTLSAAALAAALSGNAATASVPVDLAAGVVRAATSVAAGKAVGVVSASSTVLTKGVMQAMTMTKLNVAVLLLAVGAVGVGAGLSWHGNLEGDRAGAGTAHRSVGRAAGESAGDPARPEAAAPACERYYAGGFRSLRGFEFRRVAPEPTGCESLGDFLFLNSIEYQVPVRANDTIYVIGFVDSGTVESKVEPKDYRVSAGYGVRIKVPMLGPVPIALDFGFPVVASKRSASEVFNFWLGLQG
jgi:RNA polymerase sigma factor (sigma-70 family)